MNFVDTVGIFEILKLKNYIHVIMHSFCRYVESRQRYYNDVDCYIFCSYMEWTHNTSNVYAQDYTNNNNSSLYQLANNGTLAKILSGNLVNYLNESASILQITSMMPEVSNVLYADKINSSLHGISDSDDVEKRQIAIRCLKYVRL